MAKKPIGQTWKAPGGVARKVVGVHGSGKLLIESSDSPFAQLLDPKELKREIELDTKRLKHQKRVARESAEEERVEEKKRSEREDTDGYADQFSPVKRGRIVSTLTGKKWSFGHHGFLTRRDMIRFLVADGARVTTTGEGVVLMRPDNSYYREKDLTKTAIDYARHLIALLEE